VLARQEEALFRAAEGGGGGGLSAASGGVGSGGGVDTNAVKRLSRQHTIIEMLYSATFEKGGLDSTHKADIKKIIGPFPNEGTLLTGPASSSLHWPQPTEADVKANVVRTGTGSTIWHRFVDQCIADRESMGDNLPAAVRLDARLQIIQMLEK
jgi:hypothetical protein